jgi:transcriptional regulator with XRE-family HTH domain
VPAVDDDPGQRERYEAERDQILYEFGQKLAAQRKARPVRISQEALGRRAGLHRSEISFLERGKREPGLLTLLSLAGPLGVTPAKLLEDLPAPKERKPKRAQRKPRGGAKS